LYGSTSTGTIIGSGITFTVKNAVSVQFPFVAINETRYVPIVVYV